MCVRKTSGNLIMVKGKSRREEVNGSGEDDWRNKGE